jgi:hypothetical protein
MIASGCGAWVAAYLPALRATKSVPMSRDAAGTSACATGFSYVARRGYNRAPMKTKMAVVKRMTT